ncbi:MAG: hypothetical protein Q4C30_04045 [Bacteroidia bacterium]|nr:hypothetical protein [Bacteroidia bacterium]
MAVMSSCASTYKPSAKYKPKWRCSVDEQRGDVMIVKLDETSYNAIELARK